jgi:uncharacterized protein (TIGR02145 family)
MKPTKAQNKQAGRGRRWLLATLLALLVSPCRLSAQITIGDGTETKAFSILEIISNQKRGLRMPHLTTDERDEMTTDKFGDETTTLAKGLTIYNTTTNCIEFWNGTKWVSTCEGETPNYFPTTPSASATITACASPDNTTLGTDGYADGYEIGLRAVETSTGFYMFNYQTMNLYANFSSGTPTSYQWVVDNKLVKNANSATFAYTPPADIALEEDELGNYKKYVTITCQMEVDGNMLQPSINYQVLVVKATKGELSPIYVWGHENGVVGAPSVKVAFAHVNLGAENDTDPCNCLGDLYQWGREKDDALGTGHYRRNLTDTGVWPEGIGTTNATTTTVALTAELDAVTGQVLSSVTDKYGKFIKNVALTTSSDDWRDTHQDNLWGDGTQDTYDPDWSIPENNPCPSGWKVPSQLQWAAINKGGTITNGSTETVTSGSTWIRLGNANIGGTTGYKVAEALYLPFAGNRSSRDASIFPAGNVGYYWSSTYGPSDTNTTPSYSMQINNSFVYTYTTMARSWGISIRCVPE